MLRSHLGRVAVVVALATATAGCEIVADFDRTKVDAGEEPFEGGAFDATVSDSSAPDADAGGDAKVEAGADAGEDASGEAGDANVGDAPEDTTADTNVPDTNVPDTNVPDTSEPDTGSDASDDGATE